MQRYLISALDALTSVLRCGVTMKLTNICCSRYLFCQRVPRLSSCTVMLRIFRQTHSNSRVSWLILFDHKSHNLVLQDLFMHSYHRKDFFHRIYCCSTGKSHPPVPYMMFELHAVSTGRLPIVTDEMNLCTTFFLLVELY